MVVHMVRRIEAQQTNMHSASVSGLSIHFTATSSIPTVIAVSLHPRIRLDECRLVFISIRLSVLCLFDLDISTSRVPLLTRPSSVASKSYSEVKVLID